MYLHHRPALSIPVTQQLSTRAPTRLFMLDLGPRTYAMIPKIARLSYNRLHLPKILKHASLSSALNSSPTPTSRVAQFVTPTKDVKIKYGLRFPEQQGNIIVERGLSEEKIKLLQPIMALKESFAPDGIVEVSPAKSATSSTSVRVNSSYAELIELAKKDLEARNAKLFERSVSQAKAVFEGGNSS